MNDDESYSHEYFSSRAAEIGLYPGMPAAEADRLVKEDEERNRAPLDLGPMSDAEALGIARRAMEYKTAAEVIMANAEMMAAEELRKLDTLFTEEGERIRQWITAGREDAKSRRTLFGLLGTRKSGGTLTVVDADLALASAKELAPSAVRETVDLRKLPKNFTAPGFDFTPEANKLYIQALPKKGGGEALKGAADEEEA